MHLQDDPDLDHRVRHDVCGDDPVSCPVLVELVRQRVGPGVSNREMMWFAHDISNINFHVQDHDGENIVRSPM